MVPILIRISVQTLDIVLNCSLSLTSHTICHANHMSSTLEISRMSYKFSPTIATTVIQVSIISPRESVKGPTQGEIATLSPCFHTYLPAVSIQHSNHSNLLRYKLDFISLCSNPVMYFRLPPSINSNLYHRLQNPMQFVTFLPV